MQITDVRAVQLTRRLERPQRNSREGRSQRTFTFVVVETDAGLTGLGDAYGDQALMPTIIERRLGPMALGLDPCDIPAVWRRLEWLAVGWRRRSHVGDLQLARQPHAGRDGRPPSRRSGNRMGHIGWARGSGRNARTRH